MTSFPFPETSVFLLHKDEEKPAKLRIVQHGEENGVHHFHLEMNEAFVPGHSLSLSWNDRPLEKISLSEVPFFPDFDELYSYDGDDLGAVYGKESTSFALWSPLSTTVLLEIENADSSFSFHKMERGERGVYRLVLKGDLKNRKYRFHIGNENGFRTSNDPYGKGTSLHSGYSAVVDTETIRSMKRVLPKNRINNYVDAVLYETHIRDFTENRNTDIVNKGKYAGFTETGRKTRGGHPAGLDYLSYLGITHVQLQPVLDFGSVKDDDTREYNWGYDPISFFSLEGQYSLHPEDPSARLMEFRTLVDQCHQAGIRVVLDVVYNHVYRYENSVFEKTVPGYFFRRKKNGEIANASGCGNDFASERKMAGKIIRDSMKYLVSVFDIDGFRFDLMGLLDIDTVNAAVKECRKIKNDLVFYGEGWNMGSELPEAKKADSDNADCLKDVAFFNDAFRDFVKGPTFQDRLAVKGFLCGDASYAYGLDFSMNGSVLPLSYTPKFSDANQSINYLECHDNGTLFDKLLVSNKDDPESALLERVKLGNAILLSSIGVPFLHSGQEIGQGKSGLDNTYNVAKVNSLDYHLVDARFDMVTYLKTLIYIRKNRLSYASLHKKTDLEKLFFISHLENGLYILDNRKQINDGDSEKECIIINTTDTGRTMEFDDYYEAITPGEKNGNPLLVKTAIIPPRQLVLYHHH